MPSITILTRYNEFISGTVNITSQQSFISGVSTERLRLEAEEQARKAAEEEKRQALIKLQQEREDARLACERYGSPVLQACCASCPTHTAALAGLVSC